jgi:3-deoxy-D-manno-octulosonate 8-phosphate phosphatase (KDO 8-P phosphatase)
MATRLNAALWGKFARVKLFLSDVDGILTDATVWMDRAGESKRFHLMDGMGIRLLRQEGIKVGWISGRPSPATEQRARELEIDFLHQGNGSKVVAAETMIAQAGCRWDETCCMGDDIVDLGMLKRAGLAIAVPHAIAEAKELAHYITRAPGGQGAVREIVELILKAQNKWDRLVQHYSA